MFLRRLTLFAVGALLLPLASGAQTPEQAAPPERFVGTWVGVQRWAIDPPPPAAQDNQPVSLTLELTGGAITGTLTPFLGGDDGATIVESRIVGNELHATAVVGTPRPPDAGGRGGRGARRGLGNWKESATIQFVLTLDDVNLTGRADVSLQNTKWLAFTYELGKKRSRY